MKQDILTISAVIVVQGYGAAVDYIVCGSSQKHSNIKAPEQALEQVQQDTSKHAAS